MTRRLLPLILLIVSMNVFAASRNVQEALTIANSFISNQESGSLLKKSGVSPQLRHAYSSVGSRESVAGADDACYHVFNIGEQNGFIIVSGSDAMVEVLGYADSGSFDITNLPENFKYWLSFYEEEFAASDDEKVSVAFPSDELNSSTKSQRNFAASIRPLIATKWNQDEPFNDLCPIIPDGENNRAVTGCVATAMAQMMKYHAYPDRGTGGNMYYTETYSIPVSANFSNTNYDWDNMTNVYNDASTQTERDAVATLMYHCGVASHMDYGYSSGASSRDMAQALINNFGYDENLQIYSRDYYERQVWEDFIREELNQSRPVFYRGNTLRSGHLFLLDGYDTNNMYHINWGWGGTADGYFVLSSLTPSSVGAGGDSGGYNYNQEAFLGVQKPNMATKPVYHLMLRNNLVVSETTIGRSENFTLTAKQLRNLGINDFAGTLSLALYRGETLISVFANRNISPDNPLLPGYGWTELNTTTTIPSNVSNGDYRLYVVYRGTEESDWQKVKGKVGTPNYYNVKVTSSQVVFSTPQEELPQLTLLSIGTGGNLYQNKNGRFRMEIKNDGKEYNSYFAVALRSAVSGELTMLLNHEPVNIVTGETKDVEFMTPVNVAPGQYTLHLFYDPNNNPSILQYIQLDNEVAVTVLPTPTEEPVMTVTSQVSFADPNNVPQNKVALTAHIKNTGGLFDNYVVAFIYPASGGSSLLSYGRQHLSLDTGEEATVVFSGSVSLEPGEYLTAIRYVQEGTTTWGRFSPEDDARILFTLVEATTGIDEYVPQQSFALYPNPATDYVRFRSDVAVSSVEIYDSMGRSVNNVPVNIDGEVSVPVSGLSNGVYFMRIKTESGRVETGRFIKR